MIIPTIRMLLLIVLGVPFSIFPIFHGSIGFYLWIFYLFILCVFLACEYFIFPSTSKFVCSLEVAPSYYVGASDKIKVKIYVPSRIPIYGHIHVVTDGLNQLDNMADKTLLFPGDNEFQIQLQPLKRGTVNFSEIRLRIQGYLGLWWFQKHFYQKLSSRIIPNIRGVGRYALKFFSDPSVRAGLKLERYRGDGSEFESLREYLPGFDTRTIDWKASARKVKMYSKEYRAERNHDVILALDCGRLMAAQLEGIAKLDYAINSLLLISYIAIKSGDRVGFISFADKVKKYLSPQCHISALDRISHECESISYDFKQTNFVISMEYLFQQHKKRALIIVFTDFVDTVSAELMKDYLGLLAQRHLVLFVAIRDPFLDTYLKERPMALTDLHRHVSCYYLKDERVKLFSELKRLGIHCLDLLPNEISIPLINRYLEIRRREMI